MRNVLLQVLRGTLANLPILADGEFYFATDVGQLFVGLNGLNFKVGTGMAIVQIEDSSGNALTSTAGALDVNLKTDAATIPVTVSNFPSTQPTTQVGGTSGLTGDAQVKGVQGTVALMVQDFKDAGRTSVVLYGDRIAGATTEALATMTINKGGTITSGTSYTVTAGKTFRIQSVNAEVQNTTTVANRVLIRVRSAASVLVSSPIVAMALAAAQAALAASGDTDPHSFPDGIEISSGQQIGVSQLCTVTTAGIVSFTVIGYEY